VRSFLELSSAEQLFQKLQEKEHFLNLSMLEKDKALEQQRMRVAALSADYGRAQVGIQELQTQLQEVYSIYIYRLISPALSPGGARARVGQGGKQGGARPGAAAGGVP